MNNNLPNPCLAAIILTVSTHAGPQFVFHYPPKPNVSDANILVATENELLSDTDSSSGWSDDSSTNESHDEKIPLDSKNAELSHSFEHETHLRGMTGTLLERLERGRRQAGKKKEMREKNRSLSGGSRGSRRRSNNSDRGPGYSGYDESAIGEYSSDDDDETTVLGYDPNFLSELLCPPRQMCNRKFEMCVDNVVFLGIPIHVLPDGKWRAGKTSLPVDGIKAEVEEEEDDDDVDEAGSDEDDEEGGSEHLASQRADDKNVSGEDGDETTQHASLRKPSIKFNDGQIESHRETETKNVIEVGSIDELSNQFSSATRISQSPAASGVGDADGDTANFMEKAAADDGEEQSPMRMFHVVCVMNPPLTEYSMRVDQMYKYVLTGFVRTLRREQARSNYVWNEVSAMIKIRDQILNSDQESAGATSASNSGLNSGSASSTVLATTGDSAKQQHKGQSSSSHPVRTATLTNICDAMIKKSSLALSLTQLYRAIKSSGIAHLRINGRSHSLQIPLRTRLDQLPDITEPYLSGSYLVSETANISGQSALLYLDDPESIVSSMEIDPYSALASFIRDVKPTVTLSSMAETHGVALETVMRLTRSLVYWRKARYIVPLHHRNTYVVSPLAPVDQIHANGSRYLHSFRSAFPSLPSLPRMLSMLSTGNPRSFASHIPSRDHRDVYLQALEWLMKHGFVMLLRTYVCLQVTKSIKMAVNKDIQREELEQAQLAAQEQRDANAGETGPSGEQVTATGNITSNTQETRKSADKSVDNKSRAISGTSNTNKAAAADQDEITSTSVTSDLALAEWRQDSIISDPATATSLERKWIDKITEDKPRHMVSIFYKLVRYFDGKTALEDAVRLESISRTELKTVLSTFEDHLLLIRHW